MLTPETASHLRADDGIAIQHVDASLTNAKIGSTFDFRVINTTTAGVITVTTNTGWSIGTGGSQGLMTVAATAGTVRSFRARKTGDGTWALYAIS